MIKIALLFPGQGSQYVGMCKSLIADHAIVKSTFDEASEALGINLTQICLEDPHSELSRTEITQPALLTAGVAMFRQYMQEIGILPAYFAGHSLGEITALTCTGAIAFEDAVRIVRARGRFMQEAVGIGQGAMAAVSEVDVHDVEAACSDAGNVAVSNYNSPRQVVISGLAEDVERVSEQLAAKGAVVRALNVSAPFHSPLMAPAAAQFREELQQYKFRNPIWAMVSNVDAKVYRDSTKIITNLTNQMTMPVRWYETVSHLSEVGVTHALELGPKSVLKNLMRDCDTSIKTYSYDHENDRKEFAVQVASELKRVPTVVTRCLGIAVATRNQNWDNEEYKQGVVIPYRRIQEMQDELDKSNSKPSLEQMKEAILMLKSVFATKRVPQEEQEERFHQLLTETGTGHLLAEFISMQGVHS
ncbi:ACP S-malonyltransferase [Paenibacillus amylolyticus]|uniref:[acyl-carrier-protein] S-malonyltransferase n=1 Tax=Paenibacillus amylolyticus TaxID=1451 RepID=A0A5M9WU52_PAEAM|nr:ACP S-malonyltransferase [Paenibacillus amylolyticus]KAA8785062.1 ACP S-malonyltransferase [Paenibacillus amylolyticus]